MKRNLSKIVLFSLTIALLLCCGFPALADEPSPCTQCILDIRPDILPFYERNGWDISPENHNIIIDNWCGIDPVGCCAAKFDCRAKCELCDPPNICTQCILDIRPDILPFYERNGWDISPENQDNIIDNWCGIDPTGCDVAKKSCDAYCDTGSLAGQVRYRYWHPRKGCWVYNVVSGAIVTVAGASDTSDSLGRYSIPNVPVGTHEASCWFGGSIPNVPVGTHEASSDWSGDDILYDNVTINGGQTTTKDWLYSYEDQGPRF